MFILSIITTAFLLLPGITHADSDYLLGWDGSDRLNQTYIEAILSMPEVPTINNGLKVWNYIMLVDPEDSTNYCLAGLGVSTKFDTNQDRLYYFWANKNNPNGKTLGWIPRNGTGSVHAQINKVDNVESCEVTIHSELKNVAVPGWTTGGGTSPAEVVIHSNQTGFVPCPIDTTAGDIDADFNGDLIDDSPYDAVQTGDSRTYNVTYDCP